jgi:hypothetical protein
MKARMVAALMLSLSLVSSKAVAECDQSVGSILSKHLSPAIENIECASLKQPQAVAKAHKLLGVCYQFFGKISRVTLEARLSCHDDGSSVDSHLFGSENAPGLSENVSVDVEVGADCQIDDVKAQPIGDLGKLLASSFAENGAARKALQDGLAEGCKQ